ncbi:hypothetical protein HETIRDRAFT_330081 [Heterobasidion irregulare TC 32-1]|uniref:Uncharacterized protein n=1 Tax=Heterobasidion irregulare (strain TC 32-1) TaxID=747525 RepID=W4JTA6_HETIT|nr:uncharacterized protein HETIRDRAFT_330081 [Heterobasidion irregulare TC 32-1]ETW76131.1 hypothetical protein HETIRDRAFT_330081 [Heterobasidion irregulare TC 32-1]
MFTQFFTSILLIIRIYALYECNRYILAPLVILVATGTVMSCWSISLERSADILDGLDNNLYVPGSNSSPVADHDAMDRSHRRCLGSRQFSSNGCVFGCSDLAGSWSVFLALDTVVFGLTVLRAIKIGRARRALHKCTRRRCVMYYGVIFSMNLMNILILLLAPLSANQKICWFDSHNCDICRYDVSSHAPSS